MAVVTISREFGSEGNYIGRKVAEQLGYHFIFKKEIEDIFKQYGLHTFEKLYYGDVDIFSRFDELKLQMIDFLKKVIQTYAHQDKILIVGRCSYEILRMYTNVFHVRIQAPLSRRIDCICKELDLSPQSAKQTINKAENNRNMFLRAFLQSEWDKTKNFNLVIDTGKIEPDMAVKWIVEAVKTFERWKGYEQPTTISIDVDPVLDKAVKESILSGTH